MYVYLCVLPKYWINLKVVEVNWHFFNWNHNSQRVKFIHFSFSFIFEARCGVGAQNVTVKSTASIPREEMTLYFNFLKWGTESLNIWFPLPTLLCAGYTVKLIWFDFLFFKFDLRFVRTIHIWEYLLLVNMH